MPSLGVEAIRYSAVNARVRGLYARLLSDEAWRSLLDAETYAAALEILRTSDYASALAEAEQGGSAPLESIERHLAARAARNGRKAMLFTNGRVRDLLFVWWQHWELENLKAVFRGLDQGLSPDEILRLIIPLEDASVPWEALAHETSVQGAIDRLSHTHYRNPLRNALPAYERDRSLFAIEIALDIRYYRDLAAAIDALGGQERAEARRVLGTYLDILNILWAYRHREYYHLSAEEIVNYTLWHTDRTDINLIRQIALGARPQDVIPRVFGERAVDLTPLRDLTGEAMLPALETVLETYWICLARHALSGYPFGLGAILGYLVMEELEVGNIVTLLEAKRMGWSAERIEPMLVRCRE